MGACFLTESRAHNIIPKPQSIVMGQGSIAVSQLNAAQTNLKGEDFAQLQSYLLQTMGIQLRRGNNSIVRKTHLYPLRLF